MQQERDAASQGMQQDKGCSRTRGAAGQGVQQERDAARHGVQQDKGCSRTWGAAGHGNGAGAPNGCQSQAGQSRVAAAKRDPQVSPSPWASAPFLWAGTTGREGVPCHPSLGTLWAGGDTDSGHRAGRRCPVTPPWGHCGQGVTRCQWPQNRRLSPAPGVVCLPALPQPAASSFLYPIFIVASPASERPFDKGIGGIIFLNLCSCFLQSRHVPALLPNPVGHGPHPAGSREGRLGMLLRAGGLRPPLPNPSQTGPPHPIPAPHGKNVTAVPCPYLSWKTFFSLLQELIPTKFPIFHPRALLSPTTGEHRGQESWYPSPGGAPSPGCTGSIPKAGGDLPHPDYGQQGQWHFGSWCPVPGEGQVLSPLPAS
ncbi:uncharacterized protein LOC127463811 isoform X2 [Manacus candei]|uniref:uncharacterized protein LOC127463811 isoform X2 n=1 Tax=Manacus candei TaxID=415023 RepID=UPI0022260DBF|nr:uncharacterized protein LOC127463811 isoform X2 [Manacus candei]